MLIRLVMTAALSMPMLPLAAYSTEDKAARSDYILYCSGCHAMSGQGTVTGGIPAFPDSIAYIAGIDDGRTYMVHVPGVVSNNLTDAEIADVLNYILNQWGDGENYFSAAEVTMRRARQIGDVVVYRRGIVQKLRAAGIELAEYPWP